MSKDDYETWIVVKGQRDGKRYAERKPLNVPLDLATGMYERLSNLQIREFLNDLLAEQMRREEKAAQQEAVAEACGGYDPFNALVRRTAA